MKRPPSKPTKPTDDPQIKKLFDITKKTPLAFAELCDQFELSPSKMRGLIERARESGLRVRVAHDRVGIEMSVAEERVQNVAISPVVGKRSQIGVISDLHFGSKYCLRDEMKDGIHWLYDRGVRAIVIPGDVLEGCYRHALFEMSHAGLEDQTEDAFQTLPKLPGLKYMMITGNHDCTFTDKTGVPVGPFISNYFKQHGRDDLTSYGDRSAFLRLYGAVIHLWHPGGGGSYALSYALQKKLESYAPGMKPNILLTGHYHQMAFINERGVHAFLCPTFQGSGSAFSKSLKGSVSIGCMLLSWQQTKEGTLRDFGFEKRSYFEAENLHTVAEFESVEVPEQPLRGTWAKRFREIRGAE